MNTLTADSFARVQAVSSLLAREYARDILRLLVIYQNISASEAASRLSLHIKTAQDFLDGLETSGIVRKTYAAEKKRPYFRYSLKEHKICISLDIDSLYDPALYDDLESRCIRERKNSGAIFKEGRKKNISAVSLYSGKGRNRQEKKLNLSKSQGRFLFFLPFPTESALTISKICQKAGIEAPGLPEIFDLIGILVQHQVIQIKKD